MEIEELEIDIKVLPNFEDESVKNYTIKKLSLRFIWGDDERELSAYEKSFNEFLKNCSIEIKNLISCCKNLEILQICDTRGFYEVLLNFLDNKNSPNLKTLKLLTSPISLFVNLKLNLIENLEIDEITLKVQLENSIYFLRNFTNLKRNSMKSIKFCGRETKKFSPK